MAEFPHVVPMVSYEDCAAAAEWLARAFGFEETERVDEEGEVTHVTMRIGDGIVFLGKPGASYVNPAHLRQQSEVVARMHEVPWVIDGVWVQVEDVAAHCDGARAAGARILSEPDDGPGGRRYRVEDLEGHRWMFTQST